MPVLLFRLNGVPDDEADEVRVLLEAHGIDFYETPGGRWGTSVAGIWLQHAGQLEAARGIIDQYQAERAVRVRGDYARQRAEGGAESFLDRLRAHPLAILLYLVLVGLILYFSIKPFFALG